jgi:hypothetical protein
MLHALLTSLELSPFMVELQELAMSKPDPAVDANLEKALQAF